MLAVFAICAIVLACSAESDSESYHVKSRVLCNGTGLVGAAIHLYDDDAVAFGTAVGSHDSMDRGTTGVDGKFEVSGNATEGVLMGSIDPWISITLNANATCAGIETEELCLELDPELTNTGRPYVKDIVLEELKEC